MLGCQGLLQKLDNSHELFLLFVSNIIISCYLILNSVRNKKLKRCLERELYSKLKAARLFSEVLLHNSFQLQTVYRMQCLMLLLNELNCDSFYAGSSIHNQYISGSQPVSEIFFKVLTQFAEFKMPYVTKLHNKLATFSTVSI